MLHHNSSQAFRNAKRSIPGGVNSPVRSFKGINSEPFFVKRAFGSTIIDEDDNEYIDFCLSWGVHILGHSHPAVINAIQEALPLGTSYGMPTIKETMLAEAIIVAVPSIEKVRLVNSGTEAVMSAIRVARAFTGRDIIIKFDGGYHGHADHLLVGAGSGLATLNIASSAGVPHDFVKHTISIPYNNTDALEQAFEKYRGRIAALIVEPIPANMGVIIPQDGFLKYLRQITSDNNVLLIFDEVITGFRFCRGGAQQYFNVMPDITTIGKIIGGGMPIAAYGGKAEIMNMIAPEGDVYQAGTLSGNPIGVSAGLAVLKELSDDVLYENLNSKASRFTAQLKEITASKGIIVNSIASMFTVFFSETPVNDYADVRKCQTEQFNLFHRQLIESNIFLSPSQFESCFISQAHTEKELNNVLEIIDKTIKKR